MRFMIFSLTVGIFLLPWSVSNASDSPSMNYISYLQVEDPPDSYSTLFLHDSTLIAVGVYRLDIPYEFSAAALCFDVSNPSDPWEISGYYSEEKNPYTPDSLLSFGRFFVGLDIYWGGIGVYARDGVFLKQLYNESMETYFVQPVSDGENLFTIGRVNKNLRVYELNFPASVETFERFR